MNQEQIFVWGSVGALAFLVALVVRRRTKSGVLAVITFVACYAIAVYGYHFLMNS